MFSGFSTADFFTPFIGMFGGMIASLAAPKNPGIPVEPHPEDLQAWVEYARENRTWSVLTDPRVTALGWNRNFGVSAHRLPQWIEDKLRRYPQHGIHKPYMFPHVNGPQTLWHPDEVAEADRQGIHPSRLSTTPYAARYSHLPQAQSGSQRIYTPYKGNFGAGQSPMLAVGLGGTGFAPREDFRADGRPLVPHVEQPFDEVSSKIRDRYRGAQVIDLSTSSGTPLIIPYPELPPYFYILADSTAPENHPLNWPGSPTVIPRPGNLDWHGEPLGYDHREAVARTYTPNEWAAQVGFERFPEFASAQVSVPGSVFNDARAQLRIAESRIRELELGQDEPSTVELYIVPNPSGISDAAYQWYIENRPGYLEAVGGPGDTWTGDQPTPAVTPYQQPTALQVLQAQTRAKQLDRAEERQAMGWFDSLLDVLPEVLSGTGAIIQATQGGGAYPQAGPIQYPQTQVLPRQSWSGGPAGTQDVGLMPALFENFPTFLPGQQLGEPQPSVYGQASSMYYSTADGRPRTRDLLESVDWNGDRRYWVGGKKLSKRWIKNKILSESREKRRCRPR